MRLLSTLFRHTRNYSIASLFGMVAGLLSFPILTRVLSTEDYGLMSLISSFLGFAVALGKLGMQRSVMRFYNEVKAGSMPGIAARQFSATALYGIGFMGVLATLVWLLVAWGLPTQAWSQPQVPVLMMLTAALIFSRVMDSSVSNLLAAQERSGQLAVIGIVRRYALLASTLCAVILIAPSAYSFFGATVLTECIGMVIVVALYFRKDWPRPGNFSMPLYRAMFVFAVPMGAYELAAIVMQMGDRYIQQSLLGIDAVAIYSAAYNLSDHIQRVLFASMTTAALPMCLRVAEEEGKEALASFLDTFTRNYLAVGLLVVCTVSAIRIELLTLLASSKYAPSAAVIPWVLSALLFEAYIVISGIGLYLAKRSVATMLILSFGAALNVALNLLLIPPLGIVGSGAATLLSYMVVVAIGLRLTRASIRTPAVLRPLLHYGAIAAVAALLAEPVKPSSVYLGLPLRASIAAGTYAVLVLLTDPTLRSKLLSRWPQIRRATP